MNHFLTFQIHGNADHGDGLLDSLNSLLMFLENLNTDGGGSDFFAGIAGLDNIHPLLVHFPIALLTSFFALELSGYVLKKANWREAASLLLYLGTIGAMFTVMAGFEAAYTVEHNDTVHHIMLKHQYLGLSVMTLAMSLSFWRLKRGVDLTNAAKYVFLLLSALMCGLLTLGADLGGLMVYQYGTAVHTVPSAVVIPAHAHHHEP